MKSIDYTHIIVPKVNDYGAMQTVLERLKEISKEHNVAIITAKEQKGK